MFLFQKDEIKIFTEDIDEAIQDGCTELGIDDLLHEGQRRFKAVLRYVGKRLFPERLICHGYNITTSCPTYYYDDDIMLSLCNYYIDICDKYDKLISIDGYSNICNMDSTTIAKWAHEESSSIKFFIYKKLRDNREHVLADACYDSTGAVGKLGIANYEYGWNNPSQVNKQTATVLTASDLPILSAIDEQKQIAIIEQSDKKPLK